MTFAVASGSDLLVWLAVVWAVFRAVETLLVLGDALAGGVATAVRRRRARRQLAVTIAKWETLRSQLEGR